MEQKIDKLSLSFSSNSEDVEGFDQDIFISQKDSGREKTKSHDRNLAFKISCVPNFRRKLYINVYKITNDHTHTHTHTHIHTSVHTYIYVYISTIYLSTLYPIYLHPFIYIYIYLRKQLDHKEKLSAISNKGSVFELF